jgi:RNA polymerase sigma-70 factor (ECF subfamily)
MESQDLNTEFELHRKQLRSFIFRITANREDTEDILQETWLKASTRLNTFQGRSSLKTWIFAIATNLARDHHRARARWPVNATDMAREESMRDPDRYISRFLEINATPHGIFELREHVGFCFTCIGKTLPLEQQVVVLLKEIFQFTIAEIAEIVEATPGVVKHHLFNARQDLQRIFDERCTLINKEGVCHQCSELNGLFNPKQDFQQQKLAAGFDGREDPEKQNFLQLRMRIGQAIDPYECDGRDLHFFHFDHINQVVSQHSGE